MHALNGKALVFMPTSMVYSDKLYRAPLDNITVKLR